MKIRLHLRKAGGSAAHRFLRSAELAFLLAGLVALGYCTLVWFQARFYQSYESSNFENRVRLAVPAPAGGSPHLPVTTGSPFGRIEIPRIGISVMVVEGVDPSVLKVGVGHVPGTALPGEPGNVAIAGHRDTFFRTLRRIQNRDAIRLTTLYGSYDYLVESTGVVGPSQVDVLQSSKESELTLVTCYPFYYVGLAPDRFIVRARQVMRPHESSLQISLSR